MTRLRSILCVAFAGLYAPGALPAQPTDSPDSTPITLTVSYEGDERITGPNFDLPAQFVVGYGLDYKQLYRNLPFIATLKPEAMPQAR